MHLFHTNYYGVLQTFWLTTTPRSTGVNFSVFARHTPNPEYNKKAQGDQG